MRAIGYVRVSTEKQAEVGVSLDAQTARIHAMAVVHGAEILDAIVDAGESAKPLNRPGMARLLALVEAAAVDTVIVAKLDRLTRSVATSLSCSIGSSGAACRWSAWPMPSTRARRPVASS